MVSELDVAIAKAVERVRQMTPEQRAEMYRQQRRSFMRAEASFGSDADEADYSRAVAHGDEKKIARLEAEASDRVDAVEKYLDSEEAVRSASMPSEDFIAGAATDLQWGSGVAAVTIAVEGGNVERGGDLTDAPYTCSTEEAGTD